MSGKDFGGSMTMKTSLGVEFILRGVPNVMDTGLEVADETNQNGSTDSITTLTAVEIMFEFRDDGQDIKAIQDGPRFNATWVEQRTGVTHTMTGCFLKGRADRARATGAVSGMSLAGGIYARKQR